MGTKMACRQSISESLVKTFQQGFVLYKHSDDSSSSSSGSLELLSSAKVDCLNGEIHLAKAMFPEFFDEKTIEGQGAQRNCFKTSSCHTAIINCASGLETRQNTCKSGKAIEIWYINEYGLATT